MPDSFAAGLVGLVLDDRYRLDAVLGEGGMGAVFRATHLAMDRRVAVKLLKPHLANDEVQAQRFAREARSTLKVDSPHAVKVLDFGVTPHRDYYMVLEYLDGRTVQRELDVDGPFAPPRAVHIARQALHALGAAHQRSLVHRDVKPDNLLLMRVGADSDYTKVLDFGVAKLMEGAPRSNQSAMALTQLGMVFGTPEFMSPEQACGHALDGRSDLYSLAATLFAMLTGCGLFEGGSPLEWLTHHARTPPPRLAMVDPRLGAYPELDELLQRCLAKHRDRRPQSAEEMERLLGEVAPTLARPPGAAPSSAVAGKATLFSPSSFVDAMPAGGADARAVAPSRTGEITSLERPGPGPGAGNAGAGSAGAAVEPAPEPAGVSATGLTESTRALPRQQRGRGVWLSLGAIAVVAMIGVAVGLALTRRTSRSASITPPVTTDIRMDAARAAPPAADAGISPPATTDAAVASGAPIDAAGASPIAGSASGAPPAGSGTRKPPASAASKKALVDGHLQAAQAALLGNNPLKYLFESQSAFEADPSDVRARMTYADALLRNGSFERGCEQLRILKRNPAARSRASAAGCPTD